MHDRSPSAEGRNRLSRAGVVRCQLCREVIGVYEPLVVRVSDASRGSALAADPQLSATPEAAFFHRDCHAARGACLLLGREVAGADRDELEAGHD